MTNPDSGHDVSGDGPPPGTRVEALAITLLSLIMMLLPVVQSVMRRVFHSEIPGASLYVQHATMWIGFLGAVLAAAGGRHLGLSTTHFMKQGRLRSAAEWFSGSVFVLVAIFLAYGSARMVGADRLEDKSLLPWGAADQWGARIIAAVLAINGLRLVVRAVRTPERRLRSVVFALISAVLVYYGMRGPSGHIEGIPKWWSEVIMPLAFAVMAVRVIIRLTSHGKRPLVAHALRGLTAAAAGLAVYVGFRAAGSPILQALLDRVDALQRPVFYIGGAVIFCAFLLGAPVFVGMGGLAMVLFFHASTPIPAVPTTAFQLVLSPSLPAIPLLTLAGYVLAAGNSSQRLVRAYKSVFGWMPGGLSVMAVFVCAIFTTFTGASGVTILALGGLVFPMLISDRYPEGFSLGLVTAAGSLGLLFPPSLPVLLYSVAASPQGAPNPVGMDQLFIGGLIPGTLMIILVCLYGVWQGKKSGAPSQPFRPREVLSALWAAKWDLLLPLLVIGAFASGAATVVEAAALGATYALLVELLVYRDVDPLRELPGVMVHASTLVGAVIILLSIALALTGYLVQEQIPDKIVTWVQLHIHSQWLFLLALNVILLVLGSVLEIYSAIVVLVPLVAPLGDAFHVHPVHLGVIFLANLELGFLLPPMGLNLFLSASRFQKPLPVLYRQALPFLGIMSIGVLLITYIEGATTWLLRIFGKL